MDKVQKNSCTHEMLARNLLRKAYYNTVFGAELLSLGFRGWSSV
jgi:hypothetical protein